MSSNGTRTQVSVDHVLIRSHATAQSEGPGFSTGAQAALPRVTHTALQWFGRTRLHDVD